MVASLIAYIPLAIGYAVVVAAALIFAAKSGVETSILISAAFAASALGLAFFVSVATSRLKQREEHLDKIRMIAERWRAMLHSAPGGYCLFTIQGLLRECVRAPQILGVEKVVHIENIVAALKDSAEFNAAFPFRNLQLSGKQFAAAGRTRERRHAGERDGSARSHRP